MNSCVVDTQKEMTRINSSIPPVCLTDEHLLAEHREIKRLPYCLTRSILSGSINRIPAKFSLGSGHVLFFLDKMRFAKERYISLLNECRSRGFDVKDYSSNWDGVDSEFMGTHIPSVEEDTILKERIADRILNSKKETWHYKGRPITSAQAITILNEKTNAP